MKLKKFTQLAICFFLMLSVTLTAEQQPKVLLINSDTAVEKYHVTQEEFKRAFAHPVLEITLNDQKWGMNQVEEFLYDEYPDLVYCIGSKAYLVANKYINRKPIVFSSIINWQRFPVTQKTYGVSNELPAEMHMTILRYIFPKIQRIGIVYSERYNSQWFNKTMEEGKKMGFGITGKTVSKNKDFLPALKQLLPNVDALWLISDPVIMSDKKTLIEVFRKCDERKVPVFTYQDVFTTYGAVLTVSVDDATIGRQAADMTREVLLSGKIDKQVQYPAGSHISLNLKKVKEYALPYNQDALGIVNQIIE
jgi:putative ABC transport system substrate-binding protein